MTSAQASIAAFAIRSISDNLILIPSRPEPTTEASDGSGELCVRQGLQAHNQEPRQPTSPLYERLQQEAENGYVSIPELIRDRLRSEFDPISNGLRSESRPLRGPSILGNGSGYLVEHADLHLERADSGSCCQIGTCPRLFLRLPERLQRRVSPAG